MESEQKSPSILMFPWLAHGHIFPYLQLANNLSNHNFQIHYLSTPINLTFITNILPNNSPINLLELRLPSSPDLPPDYHTTKNVPPNLLPKLYQAFEQSQSEFSAIIKTLKPNLLIYDFCQPWAASIAESLGIPAVHFAVSAAAIYAYFFHLNRRRDNPFPYKAIYLRDYEEKAFKRTNFWRMINEDDQDNTFLQFKKSREIVLLKTCRSLEEKYIDYLSLLSEKNVTAVGSLITPTTNEDDCNYPKIRKWLSKKKRFSTVFISFGSEIYLSRDQMQEIAKGLEISKVNFIWVVRFPRGEREEEVLEGFLERVGERGLIVEWAPQDKILAHKSSAGFVSHCGWNSTLESVHFGVPIIGLPFKFDQPWNVKLMVEAGIAVEVVRDENGEFRGEEFAKAIEMVVGGNGEGMREKAAEVSEKMKREEGSAMSEAAEKLRRICNGGIK